MNVSNEVLTVLSEATIFDNKVVLPARLERKLYEATNKVLVAAGGKWNTRAKAHVFADDPTPILDQTMLTGTIIAAKQEFGFFESPPDVVARVIDAADLREGMNVLEPSAGHGALALAARAAVGPTGMVQCCEVLASNVSKLLEHKFFVLHRDFLETKPLGVEVGAVWPTFDRVVMNPPFAGRADLRHVLHALTFLKPCGKLVAVMSAGVSFRRDKLTDGFRSLVNERRGAIESLPEGSFKTSGTSVNTVLVTVPGSAA